MKQKLKDIWNSSGRWFLIGLPIAVAVIAAAAWQANRMLTPPAQTIAQPPVEQEVTFDMEVNRAYTSEDGIVVIQPSGKEDQAAQNMQKLQEQVWAETIPSRRRITLCRRRPLYRTALSERCPSRKSPSPPRCMRHRTAANWRG
ncbi:hypothetical protein [Anaerotruncus sp.]|uniref:hypothetical protein n=1 Tax=Anaerotruncus sp. TaxID=1872531 RepID=UPI0025C6F1BD|nr:hypothetical protein [Anaerotruncus sp.]